MISLMKVDQLELSLVNLAEHFESMRFDIRYSREDNFVKRVVYPSAHAFLLEHVAADLHEVHQDLRTHGYGLLIYDGYRPWAVTKLFWDLSNEHDRQFLADPEKGSTHNRGCAVDLTLYELKTGKPVNMPSEFDEMNEKAYADYAGGNAESRRVRDLLQNTMKSYRFTGIKNEWWHFNHQSQNDWPVMNFTFDEILNAPKKTKHQRVAG